MPEGTVYVGNPSVWWNPFKDLGLPVELMLACYRESLSGGWNPKIVPEDYTDTQYQDIYIRRQFIVGRFISWKMTPRRAAETYLRGKDLACWCVDWDGTGELPGVCHAEILLELANKEGLDG